MEDCLDGGAIMFNALVGTFGPKATLLSSPGREFVQLSQFQLANGDVPDPDDSTPAKHTNWFNDPWGKWYYYVYRKSATDTDWAIPGFLLYSHGPDGGCVLGNAEDTGLLDDLPTTAADKAINADNLYYGHN